MDRIASNIESMLSHQSAARLQRTLSCPNEEELIREIADGISVTTSNPLSRCVPLTSDPRRNDMKQLAIQHANAIFAIAKPIIKIHGVGSQRWKRNVASGGRVGPWLEAHFSIVNEAVWNNKGVCLYLVQGNDGQIRYVGISRNGVTHRWRVSPAYDAETMVPLAKRQLFHSQCWKNIEVECTQQLGRTFEVRTIDAPALIPLLGRLGSPLSGFLALGNDYEGIVAGIERWICNNSSPQLARWNIAMTNS